MEEALLREIALFVILIPAGIAGVLAVFVPGRAGAVAVGIGYVAGHAGIRGWPSFPPAESLEWLPFFAIVLAGWLLRKPPHISTREYQWVARAGLLIITFWLLLRPAFQYAWGPMEGYMRLSGMTLLALVFWAGIRAQLRRDSEKQALMSSVIIIIGGSMVAGIAGSMVLGQMGGVLAASLGMCLVLLVWPLTVQKASGILTVALPLVTVLFGGLMVSGYYYADAPALSGLLLAVAPWAVFGIHRDILKKLPGYLQISVQTLVTAVPVGLAIYVALRAAPPLP